MAAPAEVEEGLRAQPYSLVGDQPGRGVVHQMAVLDDFDARRDRALDRYRCVGMGADVSAPVLGGFDRGAKLGLGEGRNVERAERGGDAAASRQLDLRCAQHQLLAHAKPYFVRAVGNHGAAKLLDAAQHPAKGPWQVDRLTKVAVAAGDGDDRTGRIDPWPGQHAFVDRAFQAERGTAKVADGGEAAHQRGGGLCPRQQRGIAEVASKHDRGRGPHHRRVPMRVGQTGHQGPAAAVDDPGGRATIDGDRRLGNSFDQVAANQHVRRLRTTRHSCRRRL